MISKDDVAALIPAAGRGTRLAGLTGGRAKELQRIGPLTMIEHCLVMVLDSGVTEVGVVIHPDKEEIRLVLERFWQHHGLSGKFLRFFYQNRRRGVADAMGLAAEWAGRQPLALIMPDHLLLGGAPPLGRMIEIYRQTGQAVIGAVPLPPERAKLFGNVGLMRLTSEDPRHPSRVLNFSPKGPGTLDLSGKERRFKGLIGVIFTPGWPEKLTGLKPNLQGELDDTDLVLDLVTEKKLFAAILSGQGFDLGTPPGLAAARRFWEEADAS